MRVSYLSVALGLTASPVLASPFVGSTQLTRRADESFSLYVYGPDVGGHQVMYKEGAAYAVGPDIDATEQGFTDITFSFISTDSRQLAIAPVDNSTTFNSTLLFGVPSSDDTATTQKRDAAATYKFTNTTNTASSTLSTTLSNSTTGFSPASSSDGSYDTDGWVFYGNTLLFVDDSDTSVLVSRFYIPSEDGENIRSLGWRGDGETTGNGHVSVAVRRVKASNA